MSLADTERPPAYVFVSYASADRERVVPVVEALRSAGIGVWIDQQDITGGTRYGSEISEGIRGCSALALMCSDASLTSRNVRQEIMLAWKYQRPYLPLLLEPTSFPQDVEYWLEGSQWIEVLDRPATEWMPRIIAALQQFRLLTGQHEVLVLSREPAPIELRDTMPVIDTTNRTNLPSSAQLVGRVRERHDIKDLVRHGAGRLVTMTGPGGTGKSRLAIQIGAELKAEFDETLFVELAPLAEPALVIPTIAGVLGLREEQSRSASEQIIDYLAAKHVLLILDNFEHLLDAATDIAAILAACPGLRVLTTSRVRLGIYTEQEYPVPPLQLPDLRRRPSTAELLASEAIALFVQRAKALKPDFALTDANAAAVAEICIRLDGLPLAIELAAARIKLLTPQAMRSRLDKRLPLLTGGARNLPARQQTLRNTIAWSYDLLDLDEQTLFRRLSIFAGGWSFEAAESLAGEDGRTAIDVLDGLTSLVDKSLVRQQEDEDGETRFAMLETIREFGIEQLTAASEVSIIQRQHAAFFRDLAERAEPELTGPDQEQWFLQLATEHDNLRASLEWSIDHDHAMATGLAGLLGRFWYLRGYLSEGRRWLEAAVGNDDAEPADRARVLYHLAGLATYQGDYDQARPRASEALRLFQEARHPSGMAMALNVLGVIASHEEEYDRANTFWVESLDLFRQAGDERNAAILLGNLAWVASLQQRHDVAMTYIEESLVLARRRRDASSIAYALQNLGMIVFEQGDIDRADDCLVEALMLAREAGAPLDMIECLEGYAAVTAACGEPERAAHMFGAAAQSRVRIDMPVPPTDRPRYERHLALARDQMDAVAWQLAWDAGGRLELGDAVAEALQAAIA